MQEISNTKVFNGILKKISHPSTLCHCDMKFNIFLPNQYQQGSKLPVLWYLSGLTCTEDNFIQKGGALKLAAELGIVLVAPDTSPRGLGIEGEDADWDFGTGAGMYVDATNAPWSEGYKMYSYVSSELPELIFGNFENLDQDRQSIFGHSMGGHGALICALKNPGKYKSCSAFAPICSAMRVPWGVKTFSAYLQSEDEWAAYDATELAKAYNGPSLDILVDQGTEDSFLEVQLSTDLFNTTCKSNSNINGNIRLQEGYDHSYFFISTFMDEHIQFHAERI
eukprot:TRINITY_DN8394_c0_g1_i1.p1 TRINITY_DN8394_c0_g1~~TRINITY_DN8394_c0_g1_i1.p1  ORF type:complete len:280 (-),score=60.23 TRINITY_DN8394_c0_g1_i1:31-870(-)